MGVPEGDRPEVRRAVGRTVVVPSWLLLAAVTALFVGGLRVPEPVQYLPFAASLLLFGLPHGAVDHLVPSRLAGRPPDRRSVLGVVLLYAVFSPLYLALWFAAPAAAFVLFVALTALHWGAGDLHALLFYGPPALRRTGTLTRVLFVAGRGCIPMLVPLVFFPGAYGRVFSEAAALFGAPGPPAWLFSGTLRGAVLAGVVTLVLLPVFAAARGPARETRTAVVLLCEAALLLAFFAAVPPVLAVGLYFTLWHAPRHVARLVLLDRAVELLEGGAGRALARFARDAAPLTVVALALLAGLYLLVPSGPDAGSLLAVYLVLVSTLTLPHALVVAWMDRRQGVWGRGFAPRARG